MRSEHWLSKYLIYCKQAILLECISAAFTEKSHFCCISIMKLRIFFCLPYSSYMEFLISSVVESQGFLTWVEKSQTVFPLLSHHDNQHRRLQWPNVRGVLPTHQAADTSRVSPSSVPFWCCPPENCVRSSRLKVQSQVCLSPIFDTSHKPQFE